jgi:hypothetical protein
MGGKVYTLLAMLRADKGECRPCHHPRLLEAEGSGVV